MKDRLRAIICGIGQNYYNRKAFYESEYNVVGLIDNDYENKGPDVYPISYCQNAEFDRILLTMEDYKGIYEQLLGIGVEPNRIIVEQTSRNIYEKNSIGCHFWGQFGEDIIITAIFNQIGIEKPSYLDLGANHPYKISNTALMYENGCRGINVDANSATIELFELLRPNDININVGVSSKAENRIFYMYNDISGRNTFSVNDVNRAKESEGMVVKRTVEIPVITLKDIIDKYAGGIFPDYLDCDIEGLDFEVLSSYDMKKNGPKVMSVEVRQVEEGNFDLLAHNYGYYRFCRIGSNIIYVRNEYSYQVSHINRSLLNNQKDIICRFPFERIEMNSTIALWGIGANGKGYISQLIDSNHCSVKYIIDKYSILKQYKGFRVLRPEQADMIFDYIVISVIDRDISKEIEDDLIESGIQSDRIIQVEQ